jgi:hypothetical protein
MARHHVSFAGGDRIAAVWPFLSCAIAMLKAALVGASCGIALLGLPVLIELVTGVRLISETQAENLIHYFMIGGAAAAAIAQAVGCWMNR